MTENELTNQERRRFFRCECYSEGVEVVHDPDGEVFLSFWRIGNNGNPYSLGTRLRHILRILWRGVPYGDQVVLSKAKAVELGRYLQDAGTRSDSEKGG